MNETQALALRSSPPRRRWRWRILSGLAMIFLIGAGFYGYLLVRGTWLLNEAIAEAERLDPGWRLADLEAQRVLVPDDENGAVTVVATRRLLPLNWSPSPRLEKELSSQPPESQLNAAQLWLLRTDLQALGPALVEARKLADRPRGRYRYKPASVAMMTPVDNLNGARTTCVLLRCEAVLRAQEQDINGALTSCRAAFNAGRSTGDDPFLIAMLVRIACRGVALAALERTLAQGEAAADDLAALQRLLKDEDACPLLLQAARGERAVNDDVYEAFTDGRYSGTQMVRDLAVKTSLPLGLDEYQLDWYFRNKANRAAQLHLGNSFVEITKLPLHEQKKLLDEVDAAVSTRATAFGTGREARTAEEFDAPIEIGFLEHQDGTLGQVGQATEQIQARA